MYLVFDVTLLKEGADWVGAVINIYTGGQGPSRDGGEENGWERCGLRWIDGWMDMKRRNKREH